MPHTRVRPGMPSLLDPASYKRDGHRPDDALSLCRLASHMCPPEGEGSLEQGAVRLESPEQVAVFVHAHHALPAPVQPAPQSDLNINTRRSEASSLAAEPAVRPAVHIVICWGAHRPLGRLCSTEKTQTMPSADMKVQITQRLDIADATSLARSDPGEASAALTPEVLSTRPWTHHDAVHVPADTSWLLELGVVPGCGRAPELGWKTGEGARRAATRLAAHLQIPHPSQSLQHCPSSEK